MQVFLEDMDHLDPFKVGFRLHYGTENALVALQEKLQRDTILMGSATFWLFLWPLSVLAMIPF